MFSSKIRTAVFLVVAPIITFFSVALFNQFQVYPSKSEIDAIKQIFPMANQIKTKADLILIQNQVIDSIHHAPSSFYPINTLTDLNLRKGQCFNRSLLLQKILILNRYEVRPVYLFYSSSIKTTVLDFFKSNINSHAIFEVKIDGNWFVVRTNTKMHTLENIDEYLASPFTPVPKHTRYIRYLSNRNGKFFRPFFLPDIYGFFRVN